MGTTASPASHGLRALPVLRERLGNHHGHGGGRHDRGDGVSELRGAGRHDLPHVQCRGCSRGISTAACTPTTTERPTSLGLGSPWVPHAQEGGRGRTAHFSITFTFAFTPHHATPRHATQIMPRCDAATIPCVENPNSF